MAYTKKTKSQLEHEAYMQTPEFRDDLIKEFLDSKSSDGRIKGYNYEDGFKQPEPTYNNPLGFVTDYRMALKRDSDAYKNAQNYHPTENPGNRSALNRMFDMLQVGQYVVQGGIHGALDPKQSVGEGMWEGLKAGNPFGAGNEKGEYTTSQNLGLMGWNPDSTGGKIAKGAVGFIGDVLLDPLTYINPLSVGGTAVFKGTGTKVGKEVVEKFTPEMAEKVLRKTGGNVAPEAKAVDDLVRRVNKARGIVEEGSGKGFGIYGDNIPFADKLGIAGKKVEFVSEAKLRAFGDATFAPYVNKAGDYMSHSKLGKLFSTKADMLDMARRDPEGLSMGFEFARKAGKANLTYKEALVELKDDFAKLKDLSPENQKTITKILEDPKAWEKITTYKPFQSTTPGQGLQKHMEDFIKKYGTEDKNMQNVMDGVLPKFKSGEQVTMRFPGMQDTKVTIEGMTGYVNGVKHYKIKGYKENIPETAFLNAKEASSERLTNAYATHMSNVKKSVDAGDTGRIDISNSAMGIDKHGNSLTSEFDDMINNGDIPVIRNSKDEILNDITGGVDADTLSKSINDKVAVTSTMNKEVDWANAQAKHKAKKNPTVQMTKAEMDAEPLRQAHEALDNARNATIKSQSDIKWSENRANKLNDSTNARKEFKRFITDKIRVNDNGDIVKDGVKIGTARTMKDSTPLVSLTGHKSVGKKAWEDYNKTEVTRRAFFEHLLEKDPAVKEMFQGLIDTNTLVMKDVNIKAFMKSYLNDPYYKPSEMVHLFHKDHDTITRLLERKYGKYEKLIERNEVNKALNKAKTSWDGEGLAPLPDGLLKERMSDLYKIMNSPELIKRAEKTFQIQDANGHMRMNKFDNDPTGLLKSERNNAITANERFAKQQADDIVDRDYILTDELAIDRVSTEKMYEVHDKNGYVKARVEALPDGKHYSYVNKDGKEFILTEDAILQKDGYILRPAKPIEKPNNITGTKITSNSEKSVKNINGADSLKVLDDITGGVDYETLAKGEVSSSDLFKAKEESSVSKVIDDEPLETPKTQQELNDDFVNADDDVTPIRQTSNSEEAKFKIEDDFNLGLISETVTQMEGKEVQGAYKTVEQALSELPKDIQKIITKQQIDNANIAKLEKKLTDYRTALTSQAEFERIARTLWGDTRVDRIMAEHATSIRAIDKPDFEHRDLVEIAKGIRKDFKSVAQMESAIGQLDNRILEGYVYHKVNPLFKSPLADFSQEELDNMGIKIPKNEFEIERHYTKGTVMPDGHTLKKGTVEEINEHIMKFGEDLNKKLVEQGKTPKELHKLFEDEISDIYLARMQGHYKLMYDDAVFGDMSMKFGSKYTGGAIEDGRTLTVSTKSLRQSLKSMTKEEQAKVLESYGFGKEEFNKLGNSFIRIDEEQASKIMKNGHAEVHQVNSAVLDKAEKLAHVQMAEDTHGLLGAYDKFLRTYKLMVTAYRPAFHFNNMKGNAFNNYLDVGSKALSPKYNMAGIDMALGKNLDTVIELGGTKYTYKEIVDEMTIQGHIGNGFFGKDIKKQLEEELTAKESPLKKAFNKPTELGSQIEDQAKLVNFMANLDLGKSFTEAGEHVDKFLFDYGDITKFESEVMKRIFPFYTWMRKNAPLQLEQMLTNPKRYAPVAKAIDEMEDMVDKNKRIDKDKVPAFAKDWVQLPFNIMGDNGNEEALMWSNNLPYMDINKIPNILSAKDSAINLFESSSPAIKMPIELGTNYNYFFDREIDKGAKVVDPSGKFKVSPQVAYLLSQVPQYAEPAGAVKKSGIDRLIHILDKGVASGVKSYDNAGYGGTVGGGSSYQEQTSNIDPQTGYPIKRHSVSTGNDDFVPPYTIDELTKNLFEDEGKKVPSEDIPMHLGGDYFRQNK